MCYQKKKRFNLEFYVIKLPNFKHIWRTAVERTVNDELIINMLITTEMLVNKTKVNDF